MNREKILFFILGIGCGLVIASLFFGIYPREKIVEVSEDEIILRARELGMVPLKENIATVNEKDQQENEIEKVEEIPLEEKSEAGEDIALEEEVKGEKITIYIEKGLNSDEIFKLIEEANLFEDMNKFKSLIKENSLEKKMIYGKYELEAGITEEDFIEIITKNP